MQVREMLESLSDNLLRDDRIVSPRERELLADLLRRATRQSSSSRETLNETLARAVGETIAARAYTVFGESLIRCLLDQSTPPEDVRRVALAGTPPSTPPGPSPDLPPGPHSPSPGPPGAIRAAASQKRVRATAAVVESHVLLDEFLAPAELTELTQYTLAREPEFQISEVISPGLRIHGVDYDHRRSRVLMNLGKHQDVIVNRVFGCLPRVLEKLGIDNFPVSRVEAQITASNHGDFFRCHTDSGAQEIASREITFVYFFHREPKQFSGGELRIYESRPQGDPIAPTPNYQAIVPEQNQLVVFPSSLAHEITPVECSSGKFADSRFTVNGWLHR